MTGQGGVASGLLTDQQFQGVTPGTAICSHLPQTCHIPSLQPEWNSKSQSKKAEALGTKPEGQPEEGVGLLCGPLRLFQIGWVWAGDAKGASWILTIQELLYD